MADKKNSGLTQLPDVTFADANELYITTGGVSYKTTLAKLRTEYLSTHYANALSISDNKLVKVSSNQLVDAGVYLNSGQFAWDSGDILFKHNQTNNASNVLIKGNGTGNGTLKVYDAGDAAYTEIAGGTIKLRTGATVNAILDEDDMASDSATALATQQSIKAYNALKNGSSDTDSGERTGFVNQTDSVLSYVEGTRTFSIAAASSTYRIYTNNTYIDKDTTPESIVWPDVEGNHYFYFDSAGVIQTTQTFSAAMVIGPNVLIAYIYWDATNNKVLAGDILDERHGMRMDGATHLKLHLDFGMAWRSGLALSGITANQSGDVNSHAQFGSTSGAIADEDIDKTISAVASTTGLEILYLDGAGANLRSVTNAGYSVTTAGTGRMAYNQYTGGAWQLTEVTNNDFALCHIFATTAYTDASRVFAVMGQNSYGNLNQARTGAHTEINNLVTGQLPIAELKPIATVIFQTSNGYANAVKARIRTTDTGDDYIDWRSADITGGTGTTATDHQSLSNRSSADAHPIGAVGTSLTDYALAHDDGAGNMVMSSSIKSNATGQLNTTVSLADISQNIHHNTSAAAAAVVGATYTVKNDNDYWGLMGMTCSGSTIAGGAYANTFHVYNQGYAMSMYTVDGNKPHVWFTDAADNHNFTFTEKMRLTAAGDLLIGTTAQYIGEKLAVNGDTYLNGDAYVNGDLGIGIVPLTKLHVSGLANSDILSISDGAVRWRYGTDASSNMYINPASSSTKTYAFKNSGAGDIAVLIGATSQYGTEKLAVNGDTYLNGKLELALTTEALKIQDSGSASATEQDWIEVTVGGNTGYVRVYAAK